MQEQNFEKQVQQKMEEFSLTPSVPVWQKVEEEIQQKKRRRRVLIFWLIPFMLIGTGLLIWEMSPSLQGKEEANNHVVPDHSASSKPSIRPVENTTTDIAIGDTPDATVTLFKDAPSTTSIRNKVNTTSTLPNNEKPAAIESSDNNQVTALATKPTTSSRAKKEKPAEQFKSSISQHSEYAITSRSPNNIRKSSEPLTADNLIKEQQLTDSSINTTSSAAQQPKQLTEEQKTEAPAPLPKNSPIDSVAKQKTNKKETKWSFAIQAAYGISSLQTDLLEEAVGTPMVRSDFQNSSGSSNNQPALSFNTPSIQKGRSHQLAFIAKRKISNSLSVSTGLQYSQFSTINKLGRLIERDTIIRYQNADKSISQYYQSNQSQSSQLQEYTNRYHLIELPVGIEWQLLKKYPLRLQSAVSLSYLMGSNGLVYDANARIYYQNNDFFNKFQIHFTSGLTYQVWKKKQHAFHVGPYLQYGITDLQKNGSTKNYHLFATGIKTQFSF